ncbi:hypothetical protein HXX76_005009 [Chlamydomonas incerta]|uniref:Uncharacterized protein n=1 Tax=Chlamydomonas incerta TaxID=51695 RepID=A0A835T6E0_CHLIN|nr:hypothetical protein HXX76_005009 [Chlamydomonas incerta]|eukprot:KAG2439659.1 hypothetical protein HXX76_005009 [Chlamydomonas incerta]
MSSAGRGLGGLRLPMYVVDAFTSRPFAGNPAAVCLLAPGVSLSDELRQKIAAEMNHSETAFIEPLEGSAAGGGPTGGSAPDIFAHNREFRLRWFTPTTEVPLCGHATLASAAVLIQACGNTQPSVSFHTKSGELVVSRAAGSPAPSVDPAQAQQPVVLSMSLPAYDPVDALPPPARDPAGPLVAACTSLALAGLSMSVSGQAPQPHQLPVKEVRYAAKGGLNYLLVVLGEGVSRQQLEAIAPDFDAMRRGAGCEPVHGVIVCARAGAGDAYEVHSRFFGPWLGVNEDPVTGSAHAVLGPYWQPLLRPAGGAAAGPMRMRQCSARGGDVEVEVLKGAGADGEDRVRVSGSAALVLEGTLRL